MEIEIENRVTKYDHYMLCTPDFVYAEKCSSSQAADVKYTVAS